MASFLACLFCPIAMALSADAAPALHPLLDPAFQQRLNAETNSVLSVSDEIKLLVDGRQSYPERWRMLENARRSIYITTMYIFHDATTERLAETLIRKKKQGVDVRLIVYGPYTFANAAFYTAMADNGIDVLKYSSLGEIFLQNPMRFLRRHLHDKTLVVDGQEAIVGGMNWSSRYERGGTGSAEEAWRDADLLVRGPQAAVIELEFLKRWYEGVDEDRFGEVTARLDAMREDLMYPPKCVYSDYVTPSPSTPGGYHVRGLTRFVFHQPFEQNRATYVTTFYKDVIDEARSHVYWQSISVRPSRVQKKALLDAAKRGVDVRLVTNSKRNMQMLPAMGLPIYYMTRAWYHKLLKAGVHIYEYEGDAPMHAKGFLVDDVLAAVGSYNATYTAERFYTEAIIATQDTDAVLAVRKMFENDFAQSHELTRDDLRAKRTLGPRSDK